MTDSPEFGGTTPAGAADPDWQVPAYDVQELAPRRFSICVGIPVINEGDRIRGQLQRMSALGLPNLVDIVIADGGSRDGSLDPALLKANGVRTLLTKRGPGKLSAQLRMFFAYGIGQGYDAFIIIDGNGKDGVEAIPDFAAALADHWDYVQGSRYIPGGYEENTPLSRKLGVILLHAPVLSLAAGFRYTDTTNGFRGLSRRLLLDPRVQPFRDVFDTYNLHYYLALKAARLGFRVKELPVSRRYPPSGGVPTKIAGVRGNFEILRLLFKTIIGAYDPPSVGRSR